ncbi:MAG: amino acid ABC transporter permease [Pelagibacteraceae bacterium TMED237]|nr:MAG: amino acid ABC transporter permease [Pelagibacteraceae bacterium TMED237]|tara:strand:+ start:563 stop:1726 length:1164 start_codon:yes stop_codon:yes gene_type:complete
MRSNLNFFSDEKFRSIFFQTLVVGLFALGIFFIVNTTAYNLEKRNIATGWRFLSDPAGFDISFSPFLEFKSTDTHLKVYFVGVLNTLLVSITGCIAATILGFIVGIIRLSSNWLLSRISYIYVEFTRNVPLLLQIILWYSILIQLPRVKQSLQFLDVFYISNRGLYSPRPIFESGFSYIFLAIVLALISSFFIRRWAKKRQDSTGEQFPVFYSSTGLIVIIPLILFFILGSPMSFEHPEMKGFNFKGGLVIRPEFIAMFLALSIYTAAFISETVRAGIMSVTKGQREASAALGLKQSWIMRLIIIPQALRVIVPPLTSQYLNLTKNSSLGIAVGYADLVHGFGGISLNQTGQAIECMVIVMATYLTISLTISFFMNIYNKSIQFKEK